MTIEQSTPAAHRGYVLVVEDDEDIQTSIRDVLEDEGYRVDTASNGMLALEALEDGARPGLMLVDLFMPVMDGVELVEKLRGDPRFADIPIVILSASSTTPLPSGLPMLRKPARYEALMVEVQKFCRT